MNGKEHNCNLCKNAKAFLKVGNVCFGKKFRGKIIDENDTVCEEYEFGGFIDLAKSIKDIPEVKLNPQTVKTLDEDWKPHYEFGGYLPEYDMSGAYTITQNIIAKVADAQECACIEAIRIWAREKGYDDVLLMDENKLKEIIRLGSAEYERLHGED